MRWTPTPGQTDVLGNGDRDPLGPLRQAHRQANRRLPSARPDVAGLSADGLAELRGLLRAMIHDHRAANPRDTYREVLAAVLDYRSWHTFELRMSAARRPANG